MIRTGGRDDLRRREVSLSQQKRYRERRPGKGVNHEKTLHLFSP